MQNESWAIIGTDHDEVIIGLGPFKRAHKCPPNQTAFYVNSFDLAESEPWLIPRKIKTVKRAELSQYNLTRDPFSPEWSPPMVEPFAAVFSEISAQINAAQLKKSVPVTTERAPATYQQFEALQTNLSALPENMIPYGFSDGEQGFLGATPEILFDIYEGKMQTMALAGTAHYRDKEVFTFDQKEIQEHEYVADNIIEKLGSLGMTKKKQRQIMELGEMIHFHTPIEVELYNSHQLDDIISHLHPTPALGPLPKTTKSLEDLYKWRTQLRTPVYFGAPFGLYHEGRLRIVVAIRMVFFSDGELQLPTGCGVISESKLLNEWKELELKRNAVKTLFNLHQN